MTPFQFYPLHSAKLEAASSQDPTPVQRVIQNLLAHIPAEASGFYLLGIEFFNKPDKDDKALLFWILLGFLLLVRWLGKANVWVFLISIVAFVLWMGIFDVGYLQEVDWFNWLEGPRGAVIALAFSTIVTILASAGKIPTTPTVG